MSKIGQDSKTQLGTLYIIPTPIGNLKDITLRALEVLKEVDLIACEDTGHTKKLLNHYDIHKPLTSYFSYNKVRKSGYLISLLREGKKIGLVCNAGTPGISDPGYLVIRKAIDEGFKIVSLPGACAAICGLVLSGLPLDGFVFGGFLPRKEGKIRRLVESLSSLGKTIVIYESPYRIKKSLDIICQVLPDADVVVVRELTKLFETTIRGKGRDIIHQIDKTPLKGEFTIFIYPA